MTFYPIVETDFVQTKMPEFPPTRIRRLVGCKTKNNGTAVKDRLLACNYGIKLIYNIPQNMLKASDKDDI